MQLFAIFTGRKPVFAKPVKTGCNRGKNHPPAKTANPESGSNYGMIIICCLQTVRQGTYRGSRDVAIKMPNEGSMDEYEFKEEAKTMM
jgi:hypothetical protein